MCPRNRRIVNEIQQHALDEKIVQFLGNESDADDMDDYVPDDVIASDAEKEIEIEVEDNIYTEDLYNVTGEAAAVRSDAFAVPGDLLMRTIFISWADSVHSISDYIHIIGIAIDRHGHT